MDSKIFREAALAYQAVYDEELRQEIKEQQEFENWVNSLIEEGYDLSEYTWEEMYEAYLSEIPTSTQMGGKPAPAAKPQAPVMTAFSAGGGKAKVQKLMKTGMSGVEANRRVSTTGEYLQKQAAKPPAAKPAAKPAAARPAATPAARPAAAKPAPTAPATKPAPTAAAKPAPGTKAAGPESIKPKTPNPLMQKTFGYQTGNAPDQQKAKADAIVKSGAVAALKPTPAAAPAPVNKATGSKKPGSIVSGFDMFDIVKGYLLDEGYAETEEAAIAIMANMSEEWRSEIISEAEGSYGETPKAYSAALKTKMTAKRKPFLKAMQRRTNPANRKDAYGSPRKGLTADDRERARAGSAHGVGTRADHDYPSEGPGGITKNPKKLRKQKAMGEHD